MALTWDLTKLKLPDEYKLWIDNPNPDRKKGEEQVMNAVTEMMIFLSMFVGINEITKRNYTEFHHRLKQYEIVSMEGGVLINPETKEARMPTLEEVKWHIGLRTNASPYTKRKWSGNVMRMLNDTIRSRDNRAKELENAKGDRGVT